MKVSGIGGKEMARHLTNQGIEVKNATYPCALWQNLNYYHPDIVHFISTHGPGLFWQRLQHYVI